MKRAVIFDMDGVISDTHDMIVSSELKQLNAYGLELTADFISDTYAGYSDKDFFADLINRFGINASVEKLIEEKWQNMKEFSDQIKEIDGATDLIKLLHANGFKMTVGSGSPKNFINLVIEKLNLGNYFEYLISSEEVERGKPHPDVFLKGAELIGFEPNLCTVIEDGKNGMIAAKTCGMRCIGIVKDLNKEYPADKLVKSLRELTLEDFI